MISAVMPNYARTAFALVRGEGMYVWADDGRRFLDMGSGIAVNSLGHCHPKLVAALTEQAKTLWHVSNLYRVAGQERVADLLVANSFADTVFFNNSGAEAVEAAIKMARRYHHGAGHPERYRIISCDGSFHGRSLTDLAAGSSEKHREGFGPMPEGFDHVPFDNLNAMRAAITDQTAAILVEPVQGEGGIKAPSPGFLKGIREMCDEFGILMVLDEVQTGNGRTGKLFAHEWAGVTPDILATAKGLGGGFPVGAVLATEAAAKAMTPGSHGSTFGGTPLAMSAVGAMLDVVLAPGFLANVDKMARVLWDRLGAVVAKHPTVLTEVRGQGLMVGMRCAVENGILVGKMIDNGVLTVPAGDNVVRMLPPMILEESHIDEAVAALDKSCAEIAADMAEEKTG
ncbi:aspartate aminotransferase family protein [Thalassospiraceae bacterium LMO-SO8]|nr:aspartate aminotransferase family protein [Alphaproteobacteria bacterium LMO-S08]WND74315.1 aspartate aminotransferase family protein [Thalassospiraceae bacterium LMO-SO8]